MIEVVSYRECTCDFCGIKEVVDMKQDMPEDWGLCNFKRPGSKSYRLYHMCETCGTKLISFMEIMRSEHNAT